MKLQSEKADRLGIWKDAFDRMLNRVEWTANNIGQGFPHYAEPTTGAWTLTANGDWTGGFWSGMLWLACHATGGERYRAWACKWTTALRPRASSETVFRGFLFYYGALLGDILCDEPLARDIALEGARGLASQFHSCAGIIPLGKAAEEAADIGDGEANVDGLQSSALLAWAARQSGEARLRDIAGEHALRNLEIFIRPDHSVCQSASIDPTTGQVLRTYTHKGIRDDSTWTRAQAWALLGTTVDAIWLPTLRPRLLTEARQLADWWLRHVPQDRVAYWDFDAPQEEATSRDTSGTAIATAALLKLSACCEDQADRARYREAAEASALALVSRYLAPTHEGDQRPVGLLAEGCFNRRTRVATKHELIWGSYFLFEALSVLTGTLEPARI